MLNYIKADLIKLKRSFTAKIIIMAPLIDLILVLLLMRGFFFMEGSYNWWYTLILPCVLSMIISFDISKEKKHNYHGLFAIVSDKKKLWYSKIIVYSIILLIINLWLFIISLLGSLFLGITIAKFSYFLASLVLSITNLIWIPLIMHISNKFGSFISIFFTLIFNFIGGILLAASKLWFIPFAIPARLMVPIIKVLPNGLLVDSTNTLCNPNIILLGIVFSLSYFIIFNLIGIKTFTKQEV